MTNRWILKTTGRLCEVAELFEFYVLNASVALGDSAIYQNIVVNLFAPSSQMPDMRKLLVQCHRFSLSALVGPLVAVFFLGPLKITL